MPDDHSHNLVQTPTEVSQDLQNKHRNIGRKFRVATLIFSFLLLLGIVGFVLRLMDGVNNTAIWGYHAALFAFILTTAQAAPMVAIATRLVKGHWNRPITRASELFSVVGLFNLILFIPLLWVLPSLEDGRRTLWFFDATDPKYSQVPIYSPHIWSTLALVGLVLCGLALLWMSALPDLATLRDSSTGKRHRFYSLLARGWYGTSRQWYMQRHRLGILGALYFMMLVTVHFLISVDFAMALVPGWIDALFPITHAHNSLQAGVATVLIAMFILHRFGGYKNQLELDQFWGAGKLLFALSLLWIWFWFSSFNVLWYGAKPSERSVLELIMVGPYQVVFITAFILVFITPFFALIWNPVRRSIWGPTIIAGIVLIGTMLDKIRIYVPAFSVADQSSQHELHHIPAAIAPGLPDILIWIGAISGSVLIYLIASRIFPPISIWEQKEVLLYKIHKRFHRTEVMVLGKPE